MDGELRWSRDEKVPKIGDWKVELERGDRYQDAAAALRDWEERQGRALLGQEEADY